MKSKTLFYLILLTLFASLIPAMHAQTFSVIHTFTGGVGGAYPSAGVTIRGNALYGPTGNGYQVGGTVYQLTHSGSNWLFSTLAPTYPYYGPMARVVFGPDGHLYGTALWSRWSNGGGVFKLTPQVGPCRDVACYWTVTDLHEFHVYPDGYSPRFGELIWDKQGNIYDTTYAGGTYSYGAVYEMTPSGNGYTESVLYSFSGGADGGGPLAGLVLDQQGNLFGTTEGGGANGDGTIFELTYVPGVGWTEKVLYSFHGLGDGYGPDGTLIFDATGNLYGTTQYGGSSNYGGTVFELSPSGNYWTFKLLYSFPGDCGGPAASLTMDGAGNLYGSTSCSGMHSKGSVFKLSNTQNGWVYTSLHDFTGGSDGAVPISNVSIDTDGTLYGTANQGGNLNCNNGSGCGTVWMIKP